MPRGKKKSENVTLNVPENAKELGGTNGGQMRIYTSKPKTKPETPVKVEEETPVNIDPEKMPHVVYDLNDKDHPITDATSFIKATIYWLPNSSKFVVENSHRNDGRKVMSVPCEVLMNEVIDYDNLNAALGMHFDEGGKNIIEFLQDQINKHKDTCIPYEVVELGLIRDGNSLQYTYMIKC